MYYTDQRIHNFLGVMCQNVMLTCYSGPMTFNVLTQLRLKENVLFYPKVKLRRTIHSFGPIKVKRSKCALSIKLSSSTICLSGLFSQPMAGPSCSERQILATFKIIAGRINVSINVIWSNCDVP